MTRTRSKDVRLLAASWLLLAGCGESPGASADDAGAETDAPSADAGPSIDCTARPAEAPSTRGEIAGVYDAARDRIVIVGGNTAAPVMCMPRYELTDEVWAFHLDCGSWERITPGGPSSPGVRARVATTLDTRRGRMLVFGGRRRVGPGEYENFADVWAFDLATDTWEPILTSGPGPAPRSSAVIAYDSARDRLLVFGGNVSSSGLSLVGTADLFALDLATGTWSEITPSGDAPGPRLYHSGVVVGDAFVVVGGTPDFDGPFLNDAWALDLRTDTWRLVSDGLGPGVPEARFGHEIYADPARGAVVLIAGHDGTDMGNRNDVWRLDLATGLWSTVRPGDTLQGTPLGPCDFPADFTIPEEGSPERRHAFARGSDDARAFVVGGKTDCGNVNDVWALDLSEGTWTRLRASTGGEACNRSGRVDCATLCF